MSLREISIEIIRKCPNNCVHCSSCSSVRKREIISYDTICKVLDDAKGLGLQTICLSGGEPFLHPQFCKIVEYAFNLGIDVFVYTSGIFLQNDNACAIPVDVFESIQGKVNKLIFNFEAATEDTYNKIMGTIGYFPFLLNSIQNAIRLGIVCEAHFVPMKYNLPELNATIELCKKIGVSKISFLRLVQHGRAEINKGQILLDQFETKQLKQQLHQIYLKSTEIGIRVGTPLSGSECKNNCEAATGKLNIKYDGCVYPCEVFKNKKVKFINGIEADSIYDKSLTEIYMESEYLQVIREHIANFSHEHDEENCIGQHYIKSK